MSTIAIIPARWSSSRFPGKPLALIAGKPMIHHVWERVSQAQVDRILVATDDRRIVDYCKRTGIESMLTAPTHETGTDRIAEVATRVDAHIYVNIQGDEPLVSPQSINKVIRSLKERLTEKIRVSTGYIVGSTSEQQHNPNVVHLAPTVDSCVLSFSRYPVPYCFRDSRLSNVHVGLYAFTQDALIDFSRRPRGPMERAESIELMRFLEYGERIACVAIDSGSIGVDLPEHIAMVEALLSKVSK